MATEMWTWVPDSGTFNTSPADNVLLAAPAAGFEWGLKDFVLVNNGASDVTAIIKLGQTEFTCILKANCGNAFSLGQVATEEWWLGAAQALKVNLSASVSCAWLGRKVLRKA